MYKSVNFLIAIDTHTRTKHLQLPPGDVLLHAGDFSNVGHPKDIDGFAAFLSSQPHPHKVRAGRSGEEGNVQVEAYS